MNHRRALESLGFFLDGELEDKARKLVEAHLRACPECRRELELLEKLNRMMRSLGPAPRPAGYWAAFSSRVRAALERGGR